MAGILDYYGYSDTETGLVSTTQQAQMEQSAKDAEQDVRIQENYDVNVTQQEEIGLVVKEDGSIKIDMGTW